jgi:hypothetical protein
MQFSAIVRKATEDDPGHQGSGCHRGNHRGHRNPRRGGSRKTVNAGGDGGKGNRLQVACLRQRDGAAITGCEEFIFAGLAALPDRADRVNDMPRGQPVASGNLGVSGGAAVQRATLREQLRPGNAMNRAVYAAAAEQGLIRRVDDRINAQRRDIGDDDLKPRRTDDNAFGCGQADAGAPVVTPFSVNICCSSPAWNISRMMSQPPTNSPLT